MSVSSSVTSRGVEENENFGFPICCTKEKNTKITSQCLERANNSKFALVILSLVYFMQGFLVNGLINVVYSTLERRFFLRSSETGFISSCYDIGFSIASIIVAYIGVRCHKPICMACGVLLMGACAILFSLPHFVATRYAPLSNSKECNDKVTCDENLRPYRGFFISSQLLQGMAAAPLLSFAPVYIDENVKKTSSSTYNGILYASLFAGAGIGFLVGGALLRTFTNIGENVSITTESSNWIGNWWAGFIIGGAFLILLSLPTSMFPKRLPKSEDSAQRGNENETQCGEVRHQNTMNLKKRLHSLLRPLGILLKNKTYVFVTILISMDVGLVSSLAAFGPKYVETMFGLTASDAAFYFDIIGVTSPFHGEQAINCISKCRGCSTTFYQPACGADGRTYESFCAAGCTQSADMALKNCSRVLDSEVITTIERANATSGVCSMTACSNLALFMILIALSVLTGFLKVQATLQITLRCVPLDMKTFALALQLLIVRLIGAIPMPIIFGSVLDLACLVWGVECNECGSCRAYSNAAMSTGMALAGGCSKAIGILASLAMWKTYAAMTIDKSIAPEASNPVTTTLAATKTNFHIKEYETTGVPSDYHNRTEGS